MNLSSNYSTFLDLQAKTQIKKKQALYHYLINFLEIDHSVIHPEHADLLDEMISDEDLDYACFALFIKYLLGV